VPNDADILVVEDSPTQAEALRAVLLEHGFDVTVVRSGVEALEAIDRKPPAVVISDIIMPGIDGYELCRRIKANEHTRHIPVMLLTVLSDPLDVIDGLECGANNFITKGCADDELIGRILFLLRNRKLRASGSHEDGVPIAFSGQHYTIAADTSQILDLLLSTYAAAVERNRELEKANKALNEALDRIKKLEGIVPICASCKRIRDERGNWHQLESYITDRSEAKFTHSLCAECAKEYLE